jgi:hypothetical protein
MLDRMEKAKIGIVKAKSKLKGLKKKRWDSYRLRGKS